MGVTIRSVVPRVGTVLRLATVSVIAGFCRWLSITDINARMKARPVPEQAMIVLAVMAVLFTLALIAAQFGWIGMLTFWLSIILVVN